MTDEEKQILRNISLVEVMRTNGYEPAHLPKKADGRVKYLCPLPDHADHEPSFSVEQRISDGHDAPGWGCFGCDKKGYGAIALQAALMGFGHANLTSEQMQKVVQRLIDDHDVEIKDAAPSKELRTEAIAPQECEFDLTPWTVEHLRALGFTVKMATERGTEGELVVKYRDTSGETAGHTATDGKTAGHSGSDVFHQPDEKPLPLYRCSLDREYWRGRGETMTAPEWGEIIEREFKTYPVNVFITSPMDAKQGGKCSLRIPSRPSYPIFAMTYDWGVKKYEPKNKAGYKWYWSRTEDVGAMVYGDRATMMALGGGTAEHTEGEQTWWTDIANDKRHPLVKITFKNEKKENVTIYKMKRLVLCSGPRDAMQMWAATDAHVAWLNSETAGIHDGVLDDWLKALLVKMTQVAVNVYVCYDIDATGTANSASIALENANVHWVRLPKEMQTIIPGGKTAGHSKPLNDVTDFVTHFPQIQKLFAPDLRKGNPSEALMHLLKNALTMQFWIDKATTKKTREGDEKEKNVRYVLSVANLLQFLEAKGIRCHSDERGQRAFYQLSYKNTYKYLDTARMGNQLESVSRTAMLDWIDAHISEEDAPFKANLVNTVFTGKGLDQRTMGTMSSSPINEHSWGEDFDHFFFENTAVRVDKDGIVAVDYTKLPWITNEEAIMPGHFELVKQPWRIVVSPKYEAEKKRHEEINRQCTTPAMRAAENTRWTQWEQLWKYRLVMDRPLEQMPMHFRFLYNLGRIFWEKESFGETLTATERQMQDMHFINKAHAIGYAITRHRSRARQQIVHMTDYAVTDERKASGRNGKSAVIDMLAAVRPSSANVAGKSINGSNLTLAVLLGEVVAGVHSVVGIDELPDGFKAEELYNAPVSLVCKTLYKQPVTLRGEEVPKLFIASNKPFDRSSGSTKGRIYPCFTSDYYHAGTDDGRWLDFAPKDEFLQEYGVMEVANGLPNHLQNELRNLLLACALFFFQQPTDTILPPTESRSLRREIYAMSKDSGLTDWLLRYFEDTPDNPHIGQPIAPQEMAISLLDYEQNTVNYDAIEKSKKRIAKCLRPCLNRMGIVMDPDVVLNTASYRRHGGRQARAWVTVLDQSGRPLEQMTKDRWRREVSTGRRVPRELSQHQYVHYFYRNRPGGIPANPYTVGKEYDPDYVQAASKNDPEAEVNEE